MSHIRFLDGLRGIAVLLVILYHGGGFLQNPIIFPGLAIDIPSPITIGGAHGVEIFFFISGFVLFYPYAQHLFEGYPLQTLRHYLQRRILKIIPSYWLALIVLTITFPTFGNVVRLPASIPVLPEFIRHFFFVHNFSQVSLYTISGSFWSLAIEVQFYVVFPFVAWFLMRAPVRTIVVLAAISIAYHVSLHVKGKDADFYLLHSNLLDFLDLFGFGSFAAYASVRARNNQFVFHQETLWRCVTYAAAVVLYGMLGDSARDAYWANGYRDFMGLVLFFFAMGLSQSGSLLRQALETPLLQWFSGISYNLYLWHASIFYWYSTRDLGYLTTLGHGSWLKNAVPYATAIALAWVVTRWVEQPILRYAIPKGFPGVAKRFSPS